MTSVPTPSSRGESIDWKRRRDVAKYCRQAAFAFQASRAAACSRLLSFLRCSSQMKPKRGPRDMRRHPATRQRMSSLRRLRPGLPPRTPFPIRARASRSSSLTSVPSRARNEVESCSTIRSTNVWAIRHPPGTWPPPLDNGSTPSETKVQFPIVGDRLRRSVNGSRFPATRIEPLKNPVLRTILDACRSLSPQPPPPPTRA